METKTQRLKPADLGVWHYSKNDTVATWVWRYNPEEIAVLDKGDVRYGGPLHNIRRPPQGGCSMMLRIAPDGRWHRLTTRGTNGKGGTRHSLHDDMFKAQEAALKWLDRRFTVEIKEQN